MVPPPLAPLGEFELLVLLAVARLRTAAYPLSIRDEIEARTRRAASRPAVFITLERLEEKGLLSSRSASCCWQRSPPFSFPRGERPA
jgi:hypothetical protein